MRVPAFMVFSDSTLNAIAETPPSDDAALLAIPGIGRETGTVRPGRAGFGQRPPIVVKIMPKQLVRK